MHSGLKTEPVDMVTIDDIRAAATRIRGFVVRTPLLPALWADDDRPLWIKPENLQAIGAFKVRGAFNAIGNLDESVRTRGVVAYSSGNHAQAVAYAAAVYGIPAHIVMPRRNARREGRGHPPPRRRGGAVRGRANASGWPPRCWNKRAGCWSRRSTTPTSSPGRARSAWRSPKTCPSVENVLVPVSGGGLASGIGAAIKALCPQARVFGVEPELAADTAEGLAQGHRVDWPIEDRNRTIADGLRSQPSELTFAHLQKFLDDVITVSESEIRSAVRELAMQGTSGQ